MSKVMISLPEALVSEADEVARRRGVSRSALIAIALQHEFARPDVLAVRDAFERSRARFERHPEVDAVAAVRAERDRTTP